MKHASNAPTVKFIYAYTRTETASGDTTLLLNTGDDNGRHCNKCIIVLTSTLLYYVHIDAM